MKPSRPNPKAANSTSGRAAFAPGFVAEPDRTEPRAPRLDDEHGHDDEQAGGGGHLRPR